MSGHSKWSTIKHKKGAQDAARGKIFTKHAHLITIAAREGGGDPTTNPALRLAIDNAREDNMPNVNVERAIKRGTGEDKEGAQFFEMQYEGYGPEGVAIIVNSLTDNKNRTVANIRTIFTKKDGNLGEMGCVGWMFAKKGIITLKISDDQKEAVELLAIDLGADDVKDQAEHLEIITLQKDFFSVKSALEKQFPGAVVKSELVLLPSNTVEVTDKDTAEKVIALVEALEEDDDVSSVATNANISDAILKEMSES